MGCCLHNVVSGLKEVPVLRVPKLARDDAKEIRRIENRLQDAIEIINKTADAEQQQNLIQEVGDLERRLAIAQSRHLLLGARTQGVEVKPECLRAESGLEWLTPEGIQSVKDALRRRRTEDWMKVIPIAISSMAIIVSITNAVNSSRAAQQRDALLNRSWLSAITMSARLDGSEDQQSPPTGPYSVEVKNFGHAPAFHAVVEAQVVAATEVHSSLTSLLGNACAANSKSTETGDFIPPGSSVEIMSSPTMNTNSLTPDVMIGCIRYDDVFDRKRHATSFGFRRIHLASESKTNAQQAVWVPFSTGYGVAY
jgi:hypothetical protein